MAALSSADAKFIADMTEHHRGAIVIAKAYLAAPPGDRRANLSEMARGIITAQTAEMAQMRSMSSGDPSTMKSGGPSSMKG